MKKTILATALAGMMLAGGAAQAVQITMTLDSWENVPAASGFGTFSIVDDGGSQSPIFELDNLIAMCLEPTEYVTIGNTYRFDLLALQDAPTSDYTPEAGTNVGMGAANAALLSDFAYEVGFTLDEGVLTTPVADLTAEEKGALGLLHWEAREDTMDLTAGIHQSTNADDGYDMAQDFITAWTLGTFPEDISWAGFGLLNIHELDGYAADGTEIWKPYAKQDFAFYTMQDDRGTVPEPASWVLMGSGLAGLGFIRRRKVRNI